jgi:2-C-methyl-D-erythritol 4-phosphate cytidylyltransferase
MSDSTAVIFPAAGRSTRFGRNKLLEMLDGRSVIRRAVEPFLALSDVTQILIATDDPEPLKKGLGDAVDPRIRFCPGGETRAHSVRSALGHVPTNVEWIAVHDAARPLVSCVLIGRIFVAAKQFGAAVPALPVQLTIKQATGPLPALVERTVPRQQLWAMQTPQIMVRADLQAAFDRCPIPLDQVTDDVQLLELIGLPVYLVDGDERNLKITTGQDLLLADSILRTGI